MSLCEKPSTAARNGTSVVSKPLPTIKKNMAANTGISSRIRDNTILISHCVNPSVALFGLIGHWQGGTMSGDGSDPRHSLTNQTLT